MTSRSVVDAFMANVKCRKPGHEGQPCMFVCNTLALKDRLGCSTCIIANPQFEKNFVNIKTFLASNFELEQERNKVLMDNKNFGSIVMQDEGLVAI